MGWLSRVLWGDDDGSIEVRQPTVRAEITKRAPKPPPDYSHVPVHRNYTSAALGDVFDEELLMKLVRVDWLPENAVWVAQGSKVNIVGESRPKYHQRIIDAVGGVRTGRHHVAGILRHERENQFDDRAIEVVLSTGRIGYFPNSMVGRIFPMVKEYEDAGLVPAAVMRAVNAADNPDQGYFGVRVFMSLVRLDHHDAVEHYKSLRD